jgi:hypothetical protein
VSLPVPIQENVVQAPALALGSATHGPRRLVRQHASSHNEDLPHMSLDRDAPVARNPTAERWQGHLISTRRWAPPPLVKAVQRRAMIHIMLRGVGLRSRRSQVRLLRGALKSFRIAVSAPHFCGHREGKQGAVQ